MTCEGEKGGAEIVNGKCPAVVVCCMDNRFRKEFSDFAEKKVGNFNPISIPGGVQSLNVQGKESIAFYGIRLSVVENGAKQVLLFAHEDCKAYGGSAKFSNDLNIEQEFHEGELRKAEEFLHKNLPGVNIAAFYAKKRNGLPVFEEV